MNEHVRKWDVFISHASEDKDAFVRPLAVALQSLGVSVWYDEFALRLGDSLSRSIDKGLAESSYGLVVISPDFIRKPWPDYELRGLISREIEEKRVILPIWHGVTRRQVLDFSPPLADKVAIKTAGLRATDVALQILREVRPDLYDKHPRADLERIASGEALRDLQTEIELTREELSEYQCPFCGAALAARMLVPVDDHQDHWVDADEYECGYESLGGYLKRPCPSDPRFPSFEDYDLEFQHNPDEPNFKWECYARPKTDMARRLYLPMGMGRTREEAEQFVRARYEGYARRSDA